MLQYKITKKEALKFVPKGHAGVTNWEMVGPKTSNAKNISIWLGELANGGVAEPHKHDVEEQVYYVTEGVVRIVIGEQEFEAKAGDGSLYFVPSKTLHAVYALSAQAKVFVITSPAVLIK